MPLKNSNTVALERRMDLASLFCMIGRHGPAVALAVIAMVSVLAGFIIYRTVRGKRRKAGAADGDGKSPGAERDSSLKETDQEPELSPESTDLSDEGSSDIREDGDPIQSDLNIRHRRAAAAEKNPPLCSPMSHSVPEHKHWTSVVQDCYKAAETCAEEAGQSLHNDVYAEMDVEDDVCQQGLTDVTIKVAEEDRDNDGCLKSELIYSESQDEKEVLQVKYQEDENTTTDKEVSDEKASQEKENLQCVLNSPLCSDEQDLHMSENGDDDRLQDNKTTPEPDSNGNVEVPIIPIKDVPVSHVCTEEVEIEENRQPYVIDYFSPEEKKNEGEVAEESEDNKLVAQLAEIGFSAVEREANLSSSQQDQCDDVKDEVMLSIQDGDWKVGGGLSNEVIEGSTDGDHLNNHTPVEFDSPTLQFDKQQLQTDQKNEKGLSCGEDDVVKRKMVTSCEERDSQSVVLGPARPCLNQPVEPEEIDNGGDDLCGTSDAKAQISDVVGFLDLSAHQQSQREVKNEIALDADLKTLDQDLSSLEKKFQSQKYETGTVEMLAEESEGASCSKDQQSDHTENNETSDNTQVGPATDEAVCENASFTAPVMSTEISHPDVLSTFKDKHGAQMQNNAGFPEVASDAALDMTERIKPPMCQVQLPSFEQSELTWSTSDLGEESGISSMTVSPDLQDAGNECDMAPESVELPVTDCDPQSKQGKIQNNLFADDVAVSVINEDTAGMICGTSLPHFSQQPHSEDTVSANDESFAANEDTFGNEIEDSYQRAMDQFVAQISVNDTNLTNELKKETVTKAVIEVVENKETKGEKEEEDDYEKTEISIMEATMDNNEWITDGNHQVLPWMNLSVPSFAQNHTKTDPPPSEEYQHSSSLVDVSCIATDLPPCPEVRQINTASLVDENTEYNKKVVAVQPMPQNVNVTFRIHYVTQSPYQKVAIMGSQQELGSWKDFIPLESNKDGYWATVVSLPAESHVEWKFVVVEKGEVCRWEECGNRLLDTGCGDDLLVHKWWGFL